MISMRGPSMRRKLKGVPQSRQKSRSAIEEERNAAGWPRVQAKSPFSISAKDENGAPDAFWHIRQWQMLTLVGGADSAKRIAPHWQPPVRTGLLASVMLTPPCSIHAPVGFLKRRQRIRAGENEITDTGAAQRRLLLAGLSRQIDMLRTGVLKGFRGFGRPVGIDLVRGAEAGQGCSG